MPKPTLRHLLGLMLVASCSNVPSGVLFRCEPDGSCPSSNLRCVAIEGEKYCVPLDGGVSAGGAGGGSAGGSAGGATAGGASGGMTAGGMTAGGMAGGASAGGSAAGGSAGGAAGGATAGGTSGGMAAGGAAGGATAGGTSGGTSGGSTAGGTSGGSTAGGASGGSTAGGTSGGSTAGGASGGSTAGGTSGGSTAGGTAGGMMSAGGTAGGGGSPVVIVIPNNRYVGITQVATGGAPASPVIATVREPFDAGLSVLEGWSPMAGTPSQARLISWSSAYRVTAIASNLAETAIAVRSPNSIGVEAVLPLANFGTNGFINIETFDGGVDAGVSRLSMLPAGSTAPALAFVQGSGSNGSARLHRVAVSTGVSVSSSYFPTSPGVAYGDDVIDSPEPGSSSSRLLVTARCTDACTFGGTTVLGTGLVARFAWMLYPPAATALGMTSMHSVLLGSFSTPVFSPTDPVRVASDGNNFVYFGGQGAAGELVVERRAATNGMRDGNPLSSTGPLQLVDMKRAPNGTAVLLLATYQTQNVSFVTVLPYTAGNQRNVVVIRIDATLNVSSTAFNLPGDQQAVGFASGGNGILFIAINDGPNAVLWRIPEP